MKPVERTLIFTDVVDSTAWVQRLGDEAAAAQWAGHDEAARELLRQHDGLEIDRSDGLFLLFESPAAAAAFVLGYHAALQSLSMQARAAVHVGSVRLRRNQAADIARGAKPIEVEGLAKPYAARLMALARGGQTLLSAAARDALVGSAMPVGGRIESHGHYRLKGMADPVEVFELGRESVSAFAPPADTEKAYRVVRPAGDDAQPWQPLRDVPHNLPAERDSFIGRAAELSALARQLDDGARLVTLLGAGGTGKTRLARRYGLSWRGDWPGGVHFCDLSEARTPDGVLGAVAVGLGVPLGKSDPVVQLGHAIAGRGRCLVIVDNVEQVVDPAAEVLGRWLDRCPQATFVATSRERLKLPGEEVFAVDPLPVDGAANDAIELFVARARAQHRGFAIDAGNHAAVAEAVRLLDGLPLAIELAAARSRVLSPQQIVQRLRDRFTLLAGARGAAARQATLRAAIDWSWDLLSDWERSALAQCSVFEGGFTLAAADSVLDLGAWPEAPPVLDVVQSLLDKSLLRTRTDRGRYAIDEPYFGMYVSIQEYAREKLHAAPGSLAQAAESRHGRHYAGYGTPAALESLVRHGGGLKRQALALELDNLVVACRRALARTDAALAAPAYGAMWEVLEQQGPFALGVELGPQLLALGGLSPLDRMTTLGALARAWREIGRHHQARACFEEALAMARANGDVARQVDVMNRLTDLLCDQSHRAQAAEIGESAVALARASALTAAEAAGLGNLAMVHQLQGRIDVALQMHETALALHRQVGNRASEAAVHNNLAVLHHEQGRMAAALEHHRAALEIYDETDNRVDTAHSLGNVGNVLCDLGRIEEAREHQEAALAVHRLVGSRFFEAVAIGNIAAMDEQCGRLDTAQAGFERALEISREMGRRHHEGYLLGSLANLLRIRGRPTEAADHFRAALAIGELLADFRLQGWLHGALGRLHLDQGRLEAADEAITRGDALLREVGEQVERSKLLCVRGHLALTCGDRAAARAALAEAEAGARSLGAADTSELGRDVAALRAALEPSP